MATQEQLVDFADGLKQINEDTERVIKHLQNTVSEPYYAGLEQNERSVELEQFKKNLDSNQKLLEIVKNQLKLEHGYIYK